MTLLQGDVVAEGHCCRESLLQAFQGVDVAEGQGVVVASAADTYRYM